MKLTAPDLLALDIADEVIPEVVGGAHVDPARQAALLGDVLERQLAELSARRRSDARGVALCEVPAHRPLHIATRQPARSSLRSRDGP